MFVPWMQSVVNSADDLLPQEYFSAQANLVRDSFISAGFIHFWLPVQQSGYTQATNSAPWSQLHLGQSFKAKQVTPGSPYLALVSARGAAERLRCEHVPGYAQQQDASRQARDRLEQQLLDAGHLCFCQTALRQMDREAAVARGELFLDDQLVSSAAKGSKIAEEQEALRSIEFYEAPPMLSCKTDP